jgi:hypothetical protein
VARRRSGPPSEGGSMGGPNRLRGVASRAAGRPLHNWRQREFTVRAPIGRNGKSHGGALEPRPMVSAAYGRMLGRTPGRIRIINAPFHFGSANISAKAEGSGIASPDRRISSICSASASGARSIALAPRDAGDSRLSIASPGIVDDNGRAGSQQRGAKAGSLPVVFSCIEVTCKYELVVA